MKQRLKSRPRSSAGISLIELALTMPILVILLVGITDFAFYIYGSIEAMNAAHAGAMYGAQNGITACDNTGMVNAAKADASDLVNISATTSGSNTSCATVALCACSNTPQTLALCSGQVCSGVGNRQVQYVKVSTTATVTSIIKYPGFFPSLTLKGQSIMRVEAP